MDVSIFRYSLVLCIAFGLLVVVVESQQPLHVPRTSPSQKLIDSLEPKLGLACPIELDYSPQCICDFWPYDTYNVYCNASSTEELNAITKAFEKTPIVKHTEVKITLTGSSKLSIPTYLFSNKKVGSIIFECKGELAGLGEIDSQAFIASAADTNNFQIMFCDLTDFDFAFLAQLRTLYSLRLYTNNLTTLAKMPLMPHMRTIELFAPNGLVEWYDPAQTPFLDTITINAATGTDETTMQHIVDTLLYYDNSLVNLFLVKLGFTSVPLSIRNFTRLNVLDLSENSITELTEGSFDLMSTLSSLWLHNMPIRKVYPNAFQGNFRPTLVYMVFDEVTTLPREAFENVLEEMLHSSGSFDLYGNPVVCDDCHLGWLINEKRYLLTRMGAYCANGTSFNELDSKVYETRCVKSSSAIIKTTPWMIVLIWFIKNLVA